jgi:aminoglycoside phosphotransferase (APT) family kinase protein
MHATNLQLLKAIRNGLAQLKADAPGAAGLVAQIDIAVGELLARADGRAESLLQTYRQAHALAVRAAGLRNGTPALPPLIQSTDLAAIEPAYRAIRQALVDALLPLNAAICDGKGDENWRDGVRQFFADLAHLEMKRAVDDFIPAPADEVRVESLDIERLRHYFAHPPAGQEALQLVEVRSLSGGFSRETLMAKLRSQHGDDITLILRKQLPGGLLGSSCLNLAGEVPYLKLAYEAGLPVAKILWHETDASILGGEFIVMSCMPGVTLGTPISAFGDVDETLMRQIAEMLAQIHRLDWRGEAQALCANAGVPVAAEISSAQAALAMCRAFETMWREANLGPLPTLELILDWLKRNPPATTRPAMISHGDIGFHNMMGENGHVTALLDWETARLADPAKDVSMVRYFVRNYVPWDRFVGWYRAAGGPEIDEASLNYYSIFNAFAHMLVCEVAMGARFAQAEKPELEYLQLGLPIRAFFAREMLQDCAPIWENFTGPGP